MRHYLFLSWANVLDIVESPVLRVISLFQLPAAVHWVLEEIQICRHSRRVSLRLIVRVRDVTVWVDLTAANSF
ncbi:hypothetical protein T11_18023 [Trichinella zimbabwensis]|uniref:Uncharacterized protein n=1 Tax=Trichinella zimbabwensis TaxID=268475 RepID=A0A0V1HIU5_9BILA|nr:hypothetical protein T11_18023 [Trichinella zimbabwensis]